jgi:hypothetical protein
MSVSLTDEPVAEKSVTSGYKTAWHIFSCIPKVELQYTFFLNIVFIVSNYACIVLPLILHWVFDTFLKDEYKSIVIVTKSSQVPKCRLKFMVC